MYQIDRKNNRIIKMDRKTFTELGFSERKHLQEWLADNPEALGEELLIIQKEFDGFNDTKERLDLLALDKQQNLVVIENKLDDSGKDVTWQVLKYASYASSLTKDNIRDIYQSYLGSSGSAEDKLCEFFEADYNDLRLNQGSKQRIMMVAGQFRKEVTSTVMWLMNYKIRIQCFRVTPYAMGDELFLDLEQILPLKDAEEYMISMAEKEQSDIVSQDSIKLGNSIRLEFWTQFINYNNTKNSYTKSISPSKDNWIGTGVGLSNHNINLVVSKNYARVALYISRGEQDKNKEAFDFLMKDKDSIERKFGKPLSWDRMDDKITCRIKDQLDGVSVYNREDWPVMNQHLQESMEKMHAALKDSVKKLADYLKNR